MNLRTHLTRTDVNITERAILELAEEYERATGNCPTEAEVTALLGYKPRSLRVSFRRLTRDGLLDKRGSATLDDKRKVNTTATYKVRDPHGVGE